MSRMFGLLRQCLDRLEDLICKDEAPSQPPASEIKSAPVSSSPRNSLTQNELYGGVHHSQHPSANAHPHHQDHDHRPASNSNLSNSPSSSLSLDSFVQMEPTMERELSDERNEKLQQITFDHRRQNEHLNSVYQARLQKLQRTIKDPTALQTQMSDLNLYYIRQKGENEAILKAALRKVDDELRAKILAIQKQNDAHQQQLQQLQQQQQQQQSKRSPSLPKLITSTTEKTKGLARKLIKQEIHEDKIWQQQLMDLPPELRASMTSGHVTSLLTAPDHPVGKRTIKFIIHWKERSLACQDGDLDSLRNEILPFIDEIEDLLYQIYPILQKDPQLSEVVRTSVELALFSRFYQNLSELYKQRYEKEDTTYHDQCVRYKEVSPKQIGVTREFWFEGLDGPPYEEVYRILSSLTTTRNPTNKLNILLESTKTLCNTVMKYHESQLGTSVTIGADQLLPLLSYVLIKADIPFAYSEVMFMSDFISDAAIQGELGYTLATFQSCIQFLLHFNANDVSHIQNEQDEQKESQNEPKEHQNTTKELSEFENEDKGESTETPLIVSEGIGMSSGATPESQTLSTDNLGVSASLLDEPIFEKLPDLPAVPEEGNLPAVNTEVNDDAAVVLQTETEEDFQLEEGEEQLLEDELDRYLEEDTKEN
eukprot:TRINITY_DN7667_c0_g1_i1.p1 TRINITY_DN7667_c0_g1~~TRINITY_DN7667_c0_g1_i1.p1  ORF type:complete len:652 (+),score=166.69 TRINITY_DN7667_c0_g1_i1:297-2252(+)